MQFRVTTADGKQPELEVPDFQAAVEITEAAGYPPDRITSVWYFDLIGGQWRSGDNLLAAYRAARNFKED